MKKILLSIVSLMFVMGALTSCGHGGTQAPGNKGCADCAGASKDGKAHDCPDCKK